MSSNLNNTTPAAPGGNTNVTWQSDSSGNVSGYVPTGAAGALVQIAQNILLSDTSSVTFSSIAATYTDLIVSIMGRSTTTAQNDSVQIQYNADTGANYDQQDHFGANNTQSLAANALGATSALVTFIPAASATANWAGGAEMTLFSYAGTTFFKQAAIKGGMEDVSGFHTLVINTWHMWKSATAINAIKIFLSGAGNFKAGSSFTLYGRT